MKFDPINIVHILIIWQSLLFAIVLLTPKYNKNKSNKFLSLLLFTLGVHFIYNILYSNGYYLSILPAYSCSYGYLYGPLIFLHIKFYLVKDASFKPIYWLHFAPFLITLIATSLGYPICNIAGAWILPVMLAYSLFSFWEIAVYKRTILQVSSRNPDFQIKWLKTMLVVMVIIVIINMIQSQMNTVIIGNFEVSMEAIVQIGVLALVNIITYQGLKNPQSFQQISESDLAISKSVEIKNSFTTIDTKELEDLANQLKKYMELDKAYLNPDLNLNTLSIALDVPEKTVSQTINQLLGSNFSDYVNSYRIVDAKSMLDNQTEPSLSIKEIMYEVGFNSRSVFNTVFKKKIGLTPSEYKNRQK